MEIKKYLRCHKIFKNLTEEEMANLLPFCEEKSFQKKETIITEGEETKFIVVIKKGKAGIYKDSVLIQKVGPDDVVGEMAILEETIRATSVVALTEVTAYILHLSDVDPHLLLRLKENLTKKVSKTLRDTNLLVIASKHKYRRISLLLGAVSVASIGVLFVISGYLPDREAERVLEQLYQRDEKGVILGEDTISIRSGQKTLVFFLHAFLMSPDTLGGVIKGLQEKHLPVDYYAPLAPFHARDLQAAARLDMKTVVDFYRAEIQKLAKQYEEIIFLGHSMGGAILLKLSQTGLPRNSYMILYAPAVHISSNNFFERMKVWFFKIWRNYCNYEKMGCGPSYESGDVEARKIIASRKDLRYKIASATLQVYHLDNEVIGEIAQVDHPFSIIMAKNDNRVRYEKVKEECDENARYCTFYAFPEGRHLIHWGKNKQEFIDLLAQLIQDHVQ